MTAARAPDHSALMQALGDVYDPCCADRGISIVDMGVVEDVRVDGPHVDVDLVLTSGWCPFAARLLTEVQERVEALPGVDRAEVEVVWDEPWTLDRLSPSAAQKLRFLPPPAAVGDRDAYIQESRAATRRLQEEQ